MIQLQREGEVENPDIVNKAKDMFKMRNMKRKGFRFTKETQNHNNAKSELKRPG